MIYECSIEESAKEDVHKTGIAEIPVEIKRQRPQQKKTIIFDLPVYSFNKSFFVPSYGFIVIKNGQIYGEKMSPSQYDGVDWILFLCGNYCRLYNKFDGTCGGQFSHVR